MQARLAICTSTDSIIYSPTSLHAHVSTEDDAKTGPLCFLAEGMR